MNHFLADHPEMNQEQKLVVAGFVGGAVQSVVDVPIEVAKTRLMTSTSSTTGDLFSEALKFRGGAATMSRNMIFAAVMNFGLNYQKSKNYISGDH